MHSQQQHHPKVRNGTQAISVRGSSSLSDVASSTQSQKWNDTPRAHSQPKLFWGEPGGGIQGLILASMCTNSKFSSQIDKYFWNSVFIRNLFILFVIVLVCEVRGLGCRLSPSTFTWVTQEQALVARLAQSSAFCAEPSHQPWAVFLNN